MASKQTYTDSKAFTTDVYHDGQEVAVRARSQHSRSAHMPATDDDGNVVFDEDGHPEPACGCEPNTDTEWVTRPIADVANRDKCKRCFEADDVAERNKENGGSVSFARRMRYGDDWGEDDGEEQSAKASQGGT